MSMNRRHFLQLGAFSALASAGFGALLARAAGSDYKAAVCVFLSGGCDSNNLVVPTDSAGYAAYQSARTVLALPKSTLLPISPASGGSFGLHPAMPELQTLFSQRRLAILANVGTLMRPTTKAQALSGRWPLPDNLLSHFDQQNQWSTLNPALLSPQGNQSVTGWGGRMADALRAMNAGNTFPPVVSVAGNNLFCDPLLVSATAVEVDDSPALPSSGDGTVDAARNAALAQLGSGSSDLALQGVVTKAFGAARKEVGAVQGAFAAKLSTAFPSTDIGQQLYRVAQMIAARGALGLSRQVFYVELDGFDTHANQLATQQDLLGQLSKALSAFYAATVELGVASQVVTFTHSEFSRTLKPAGDVSTVGSDHAWGGHSLILGGSVQGGDLYGTFPQLTLNGPDDMSDEGRWVPTTSVDQYAATVATWMGVADSDLATVLPNLSNFNARRLGFL